VLGFNVDAEKFDSRVEIITDPVIYRLIERFDEWQELKRKELEAAELGNLMRPAKLEVLRGYIFRQSNPAVFGVSVEAGTLKTAMPIMNPDGRLLGTVKSLQSEQESISRAERGKQVALAMDGIIVGRQVNEGDILYSDVPEDDFRKLKKFKQFLSTDEKEALREIAAIKRRNNVVWGV
jgi:translation initiation factor 5B